MEIIPADATLAELEQLAKNCEQRAAQAPEPEATQLREKAELYREWLKVLRTGRWTS